MSQPENEGSTATIEQLSELERLTEAVKVHAAQLYSLVFRMYGDWDDRTLRAEQITAAVQRYKWALVRAASGDQATQHG